MAKLTRVQRERLPSSKFACPASRSYPIHDLERIVNARTRTKQFGQKCPGQKQRICAAAKRRKLLRPSYKGSAGWRKWCGG